jgi:hypothetical protein
MEENHRRRRRSITSIGRYWILVKLGVIDLEHHRVGEFTRNGPQPTMIPQIIPLSNSHCHTRLILTYLLTYISLLRL